MRKLRGKGGFTLAELLIVIAIIAVLSGVAALAYTTTQRNLAQRECETTAKEIFIAAQNHIALAKSQNYLGVTEFGKEGTLAEDKSGEDPIVYYIVVNQGSTTYGDMLDQILPFGSIDETVRAGGSYLIRYQPDPGLVLDVFYSTQNGSKYDCGIKESDYENLMNARDTDPPKQNNIGARRDFQGTGKVVGWFGGESVVESGGNLVAPILEVENAERLLVRVTDPNILNDTLKGFNPMLKLLISNESRTAECVIPLTKVTSGSSSALVLPLDKKSRLYDLETTSDSKAVTYTIVLDDITKSGMHFADLVSDSWSDSALPEIKWKSPSHKIIPGENIYIRVVAYSNEALTNVAYSGEWLTNSLFAELREETDKSGKTTKQALIENIRHLENLSDPISGVNGSLFEQAVQTSDLVWPDFIKAIDKDEPEKVSVFDKDGKSTKGGCFLPVSPTTYALNYNGQTSAVTGTGDAAKTVVTNHSIKGIVVNDAEGDAEIAGGGVFGKLKDATIENLELIDCSVTVAGSGIPAGTLAGELEACTVTNVLSHNSAAFEKALAEKDETKAKTTVSAAGDVGGLAGTIKGESKIERCAAALIVKSTAGSAGGLIGSSTGGTVTACYSGGHTIDDTVTGAVKYSDSACNVTAEGGNAGGLIGDAGDTKIENCYSTCSAKGGTAGGLVGVSSGRIDNSYCTGMVSGTAEGAFAGSFTGNAKDCHFFEIINERVNSTTGEVTYLPIYKEYSPESTEDTGIKALDESARSYDTFCGSDWKDAAPYYPDSSATKYLIKYYGDGTQARYNLKTVDQLAGTEETSEEDGESAEEGIPDFVAIHYGDWPVPEIFVLNTK